MKTSHKLIASFLTLLAACALHAADPKPANRVVSILDVQTDDPVGYAIWMKRYNEIAKAKLGVDNYTRVYQSYFDSRPAGYVRVVTTAATVAELMKNAQALDTDPGDPREPGTRQPHSEARLSSALSNGADRRTVTERCQQLQYTRGDHR